MWETPFNFEEFNKELKMSREVIDFLNTLKPDILKIRATYMAFVNKKNYDENWNVAVFCSVVANLVQSVIDKSSFKDFGTIFAEIMVRLQNDGNEKNK